MANSSEIALIETGSEKNRKKPSTSGEQFGPHVPTTLSEASLDAIKTLCNVPSEVEFAVPGFGESPESCRPGYITVYEVYFTGCGLFFPLPEVLLLFLHTLGMAFSQMTPNMLRVILAILTVAAEAGYSLSASDLAELCSVRNAGRGSGQYAIYPNADRILITGLPDRDDNWRKRWFLVKINGASITGLTDMLETKWASSLVPQIRPAAWNGFLEFYSIVTEGNTIWNSFSLDRIHRAGESLRRGMLRALAPAPEAVCTRGMSCSEKTRLEAMQRSIERRVKAKIDAVGKRHREKSLNSNDKTPGKRCLISNLSSFPPISSRVIPLIASEEEDDITIASLKRKRRTKDRDMSSCKKSKLGTDDQGSDCSDLPPLPPPPASNKEPLINQDYVSGSSAPDKQPLIVEDSIPGSSTAPSQSRVDEWMNMAEIFRVFPNRSNVTIPPFDKWRPAVRNVYINHARHTTQAIADFNDIVCHYEKLLHNQSPSSEVEAMKKLISEHEKTISEQGQTIELLRKEGDDARKKLEIEHGRAEEAGKCWEEKISALQSEQRAVKAENVKYKGEVTTCQEQLNGLCLKYDALLKLREDDMKGMKSKGCMLLEQVSKHLKCVEARAVLRTDANELKSNLILLGSMKKDDFDIEKEIAEVESSLAECVAELDRFVVAPFDQQQFAADFAESPSLPAELELDLLTRSSDVPAANGSVVSSLSSDKDRAEDAPTAIVEDRSTDDATIQAFSRDNPV